MDPLIVVSPHFDDAVLSCGQFIAGRGDVTILTVFGGTPVDEQVATGYDRRCGFASSLEAVKARRVEDTKAAGVLRARTRSLDFIDDQYRDGEIPHLSAWIADKIAEAARRTRPLVAPLGLRHPDHVAVSDAVLLLADRFDVWLYEELPARVLWPEEAATRLARVAKTHDVELEFIGDGPMSSKSRAWDCYRSQHWSINRRHIFVPERFHRVTVRGGCPDRL